MTSALEKETKKTEIFYPTSDGEPVAETYDHLYAILMILEVLRQYLKGQRATVLGNQFLYYQEGKPKLRTAPDVMVIFDVEPGGRDSYKIWSEGATPKVVFEITSPSTKNEDKIRKKELYQKIGIEEYWLFDPKAQWIKSQLLGYRLQNGVYQEIKDSRSKPLKLRLRVEGKLIGFYRQDTGEKLLIPDELLESLQQESLARQEAEERAEEEYQRAEEEYQRAEEEYQRAEEERQRAEEERQRAEEEYQRAEEEYQRAEEERQRAEEESQRAEEERQRAEEESQRAEEERQRAEEERQRAEEERQRAEGLEDLLAYYRDRFGDVPED